MRTTPMLMLALSSVVSVTSGCESAPPPPVETPRDGLDPQAWIVRASLDVRGVRPSQEELEVALEDPAAADALVESFVDDPRFASRVASIFADVFRTRRDQHIVFRAEMLGLDEARRPEFDHALAEEAVHIVELVAATDRPFSEVVTADYTVVDPILLEEGAADLGTVWPIEPTSPQPKGLPAGTVQARYVDGREAAGVLTTNAFVWRYTSTIENAQRARANALSRIFLCQDYLDRPIVFPPDIDLTDRESIHDAIRVNQACQACHSTMDPLASHLWGLASKGDDAKSWSRYQPDYESYWQVSTLAAPAYFGTPTQGGMKALGAAISSDSRFATCAGTHVYEALLGRPKDLADEGQIQAHRDAFVRGNLSLRALVKSVLFDPAYRGAKVRSDFGGDPEPTILKLLPPEILSSAIEDLTGYRARIQGRDAVGLDFALRSVAGASERGPAATPSAGYVLVQRRLAEAAAQWAVSGAGPHSSVGKLLSGFDLGAPPDAAAIEALHQMILSRALPSGSDDAQALAGLVADVAKEASDPREAWVALLTALLSDPELATY